MASADKRCITNVFIGNTPYGNGKPVYTCSTNKCGIQDDNASQDSQDSIDASSDNDRDATYKRLDSNQRMH